MEIYHDSSTYLRETCSNSLPILWVSFRSRHPTSGPFGWVTKPPRLHLQHEESWPHMALMLWLPFILIFDVFFAYHFWLKHFETTPSQQKPSFDQQKHVGSPWIHLELPLIPHLFVFEGLPTTVSPWGQVLESVRRGEAEEAEEEEAFEPKIHEGRHSTWRFAEYEWNKSFQVSQNLI